MLQKFLMIGVGGSGGKTLRYTWRELDRLLNGSGWQGGFPEAWQFLHVDCPQTPDVVEGDVPADIGTANNYLGLAKFPHLYSEYDRQLCERVAQPEALVGWRPDPNLSFAPPFKGAGQRRVVGRIVTLTELDHVETAMHQAIAKMSNTDASTQLADLNRHVKRRGKTTSADPATAIVVSSLGGGSGSGAFLDLVELLLSNANDQREWLRSSLVTVLYAADVFGHLPDAAASGIQANSLAALSELLAAYEHQGPVSELEDQLLEHGGGVNPIIGRRTGRTNFIIGAKNSNMSFGHSHDVFRAVGKAFASFLTDSDVRREFASYINTNPSAKAVTEQFRITELGSHDRPCSSFGYANVSLGRHLFSQYAAERLAKEAVHKLLRGHRSSDETRPDAVVVAEKATDAEFGFFEATGLHERGTDHNQVLEAFCDAEVQAANLDALMAKIKAAVTKDSRKRSPEDAFKSFKAVTDDFTRDFIASEWSERSARAARWVREIQDRLLQTVAEYVGRYGFPVTIELVDRLKVQVQEAASELEADRHRFDRDEQGSEDQARSMFTSISDKVITPQHASFGKAARQRREAIRFRMRSDLHGFAAGVLLDLADNLLPPVSTALKGSQATLRRSEQEGDQEIVSQWSTRDVPSHLQAAPNEILLEPQSGFPEQLDELLEATTQTEGRKDALDRAIVEVVGGVWPSNRKDPRAPQEQSLVESHSAWSPKNADARDPLDAARTGLFDASLDANRLLYEAKRWVADRNGAISKHATETLSGWLDEGHQEKSARGARFADAFAQALGNAEPLVSINPAVYRIVHGDDPPPPYLVMSRIPLGETHPARRDVEQALATHGLQPEEIKKKFNANVVSGEVQITSFVAAAVHPVVLASLMGPVQSDWQRRADDANRKQFWSFRRSRPLTAFIPVSTARQTTLVRGWLTGMVLGHIDVLVCRWSDQPLEVWTAKGRKRFPKYLLGGEISDHREVLPALLESMPLALLTFASEQPEELEAYMRLLDLGAAYGQQENHDSVPNDLERWVLKGELAVPEPKFDPPPNPPAELAGDSSMSPQERSELVTRSLRSFAEEFRRGTAEMTITTESSLHVPRAWELRDQIIQGSTSLADAVEALPLDDRPVARLSM